MPRARYLHATLSSVGSFAQARKSAGRCSNSISDFRLRIPDSRSPHFLRPIQPGSFANSVLVVADQAADDVPAGRLAQLEIALAIDADDTLIAHAGGAQVVARERFLVMVDDAPQSLAGHFDEFHPTCHP